MDLYERKSRAIEIITGMVKARKYTKEDINFCILRELALSNFGIKYIDENIERGIWRMDNGVVCEGVVK